MMVRRETEFEFETARRPRAGYRTRVAGTEAMTRSNPYDLGLDRNQANFVALSPLSFLERTASVYPDHTALIYGALRRPRRYGGRDAPQCAGDARGALWCSDERRGAQYTEHPSRLRNHCVHVAAWRRARAADRPRILPGGRKGARAERRRAPAGDRGAGRAGAGGQGARPARLRDVPGRRRPGLRLAAAGR